MILQPGSFVVKHHRKAIPDWVKIACAIKAAFKFSDSGYYCESAAEFARSLQFDHRPALCERPYDTEIGDFIPAQNDPDYIEAIRKEDHLERTTGRKAGAEKTVTTRGSDIGERARTRSIQASEAVHKQALAWKNGYEVAANATLIARPPKPKKKIQSCPFPKRKRK